MSLTHLKGLPAGALKLGQDHTNLGLRKNKKSKGKGIIDETDYYDDPIDVDADEFADMGIDFLASLVFMEYVANAIENDSKCELLKEIDINLRKRVKKKIGMSENVTVAAMLRDDFRHYLMVKNHTRAKNIIGCEIEVGEFDWKTNSIWKQKLVSL
ncbi:hypothetical protein Tco_0093029 [Tanacetum coccineum]